MTPRINLNKRMLRLERYNIRSHFNSQKVFEDSVRKSRKHLDFGCGFGFITYMMACRYPKTRFVGIDINKEKIRLGRKRYNAHNLELKVSGTDDFPQALFYLQRESCLNSSVSLARH